MLIIFRVALNRIYTECIFVLLAGFEQIPKGSMLETDGSKTKVTYHILLNETKLQLCDVTNST